MTDAMQFADEAPKILDFGFKADHFGNISSFFDETVPVGFVGGILPEKTRP
jgi:hypothetical protein